MNIDVKNKYSVRSLWCAVSTMRMAREAVAEDKPEVLKELFVHPIIACHIIDLLESLMPGKEDIETYMRREFPREFAWEKKAAAK